MSKGKVEAEKVNKGYPWPASALTTNEMRILAELRDKTGKSITKILQEAVIAFETRKDCC